MMTVDFHFLNVGHGDCTIVYFPERKRKDGKVKGERVTVIDCHQNTNDEEYTNLIEYYKNNFRNTDGTLKPIFRFICTHPHQDHIYGLSELLKDDEIKITNFWDLNHSFIPENFDYYPTHKDDWDAYKKLGGDNSPATVITVKRESKQMQFWDDDDEDRISILSPSNKLKKYAHYKDDGSQRESSNVEIDEMSYTLLIKINDRKIILASDGRCSPCWNDIYDNCTR